MSFRFLSRAVSAVLVALLVAAAFLLGTASASFAEDQPVTSDSLFSNDRGISLEKDYFEMSTPYGETDTQTITLTATQDLTLRASGEYTTPGDSFYITRAGVCPGYFGTVTMKAGDSCTLTIVFTPSSPASYWGGPSFVATVNGVSTDFGVHLHGNVETVVLSGSTDFGAVRLGESRTEQLALTNVARYDFTPAELLRYLATYAGFSVAHTSCGDVLAAGATCTIDLQFAPVYTFDASSYSYATGNMNGYDVYSNGLRIVGSGSEGNVGLTATPTVDFGSVSESAQASGTIVLTNTGEERLTFNTYNGWFSDYSGAFTIAGDLPAALEPGESAEVQVAFSASLSSIGEHVSDYNLTGYTSNYTAASVTTALHALVTSDAAPVVPPAPTDPPTPTDPDVKPTVPPQTGPTEKGPITAPPVTEPADETASAAAEAPSEGKSPSAVETMLATTGTGGSLAATVGVATLFGAAGAGIIWLSRRRRKVS
ncbi:choice-of-anchor D domain-containing protein [Leucobacter coleopterorum]|uniref:Choice-of-anchor D domain-containing protein n=1 Tax=Leucobacter coleopterorum TaxID=2714933 RepID=A0ABX6JYY1_9MICO|nr:choice-of-anchor D domain-containing protein [Leucobacter coleopterorum]QIM19528.1 choice-of-anchor D domain-containing protein [Leucobacter coleopterorum]